MQEKFDSKKYNKEYQKVNYDTIKVKLKKGSRDVVRQMADLSNKSVNQYIKDLIKNDMLEHYIDVPENWD